MTCIVKKHHLKVLFKEMQFVAFFVFHMEKTRMQVKNDLRCLRQIKLKKNNVLRLSINNGGSLVSIVTGCQHNTLKFNKYGPKSYRIGLDFLDSRSPNICIIVIIISFTVKCQ